MNGKKDQGFTLIELLIVVAMYLPLFDLINQLS